MAAEKTPTQLKITQVRGVIGARWKQRESLRTLGLRRIRHSVVRDDNPQTRGLIAVVSHLVEVEPAGGPTGDQPPIPQNSYPVGDSPDFREPVADVDDGDPGGPQPPNMVKEPFDLGTGKCGRRLIENQDATQGSQRPSDFDKLLLADAQPAGGRHGVKALQSHGRQRLPGLVAK